LRENLTSYIQSLIENQHPFLLLRKANDNLVRIISQKDKKWHKSAPDNMTYAVFSKFEKTENQVFIPCEVYKEFTYESAAFSLDQKLHESELMDEKERSRYAQLVKKAIKMLKESAVKKVVLSRVQEVTKRTNDLEILEALLQSYAAANCYFFSHPKVGKWMGATPEILAAITGDKLKTMSLAGTAIFNPDGNHIWGKKEIEEQQLVTDFIVENLNNCGVNDLVISDVQTSRAGNLIHLKTDISATIDSSRKEDYIDALHPTPAVCGLPRDKAQRFIQDNEGYDRSFYTGYLGIVEASQANYFVNLRCMQLFENKVKIYVGGGITALSNPILEYDETVQKLITMKRLL